MSTAAQYGHNGISNMWISFMVGPYPSVTAHLESCTVSGTMVILWFYVGMMIKIDSGVNKSFLFMLIIMHNHVNYNSTVVKFGFCGDG